MSGTPISTIRNLGPAFEKSLQAAGIPDAESLRAIGAHEAYRRLLKNGERPHFIGYYVLHMGLQGRPWNDCKGAEKDALRVQFDTLKAETGAAPLAGLEKILNEIGVIERPKPRP
ncbi:TfoX/Sxy family protein [Mameliella sediminis]|uniref:TfoX/Sxy family protein n=1 Tax=Mameliella sediminis TaxID=2836866 RepID=UPI001C4894C2|nr:TfoX/Sxy family protein [Mameliella sediminis]MBY6115441.1 TfoX/Sxy family protein [Antarctobacter heliothermus]MBY6145688.1 TfoX/Sxy family protein [Mameliella alba]MBV7393589.1 TfoX/Sxy family protein [Mameliella sediminis]MBY6161011.1 TfoX/Sxy family protein [Mameliella alba]MBY6169481.1 TfoX/Sxy family protein [Mameliella alba]